MCSPSLAAIQGIQEERDGVDRIGGEEDRRVSF